MRVFGIAFLLGLVASPALAEDLLTIYREALVSDSTYAAARAQVMVGREKYPQGLAGLLPNASYSASNLRVTGTSVNGTNDHNERSRSITLTQPLLRWSHWEIFEQGKLQAAQAETVFAQAKAALILRVAQAYFAVLAAQDNITFINAQKNAITEQLAQAKRNFEVGTATITDQQEAQARYDLSVAQEIVAQTELINARDALRQIVDAPVATLQPLKTGVTLNAAQPDNAEPWIQSAEQQNYDVLIQQFNQLIAAREISKARAGHFPTLDWVASRNNTHQSYTPVTGRSSDTRTQQIGLQLTVPLFAGGATQSKVREAIALENKAAEDLVTAKRTAAQNALQAFSGMRSGLAQTKAFEAAEKSSRLALASNQLGYEVGVRINIDVLNAQQQLFQTQRDLAKARYDTLIASLRLKLANATLAEKDVEEINQLLGK